MRDTKTDYRKSSDTQSKNKVFATQLRTSARAAAKELFASGDLRQYLKLLPHMHHYDAYNIMLILQQFPRATCLAGYNTWKRYLPSNKRLVLKPEWQGKGIDLVIPFTDIISYHEQRLIWYAVKQFDITQTNAEYSPTPTVYVSDEIHMRFLLESSCSILETHYDCRVHHSACDSALKASGLIGRFEDKQVSLRGDASLTSQLQWLVDCLSALHGEAEKLPPACRGLHHRCVLYALWNTWALDRPPSLYGYRKAIQSISDEIQIPLLESIRNTFRALEGYFTSAYACCRARKETEDSL